MAAGGGNNIGLIFLGLFLAVAVIFGGYLISQSMKSGPESTKIELKELDKTIKEVPEKAKEVPEKIEKALPEAPVGGEGEKPQPSTGY